MKIHEGHNDIYVILKLMCAIFYSLYTLNIKHNIELKKQLYSALSAEQISKEIYYPESKFIPF